MGGWNVFTADEPPNETYFRRISNIVLTGFVMFGSGGLACAARRVFEGGGFLK